MSLDESGAAQLSPSAILNPSLQSPVQFSSVVRCINGKNERMNELTLCYVMQWACNEGPLLSLEISISFVCFNKILIRFGPEQPWELVLNYDRRKKKTPHHASYHARRITWRSTFWRGCSWQMVEERKKERGNYSVHSYLVGDDVRLESSSRYRVSFAHCWLLYFDRDLDRSFTAGLAARFHGGVGRFGFVAWTAGCIELWQLLHLQQKIKTVSFSLKIFNLWF